MGKKIYYILFYIIFVFIFFDCAAIAPPNGGSADIDPPKLLDNSFPYDSRINFSKKEKIILSFNERILPSTFMNAFRIEPDTDISIRIINNMVYIKPKKEWPNQFGIFISRNLSDYHNNQLIKPIQLFFSQSDTIQLNSIQGKIFNADTSKVYELAILDENLSILTKTESDINGLFNFFINDINPNNIIVALDGSITNNIINDIRTKKYGISNRFINLINNPIYISDPIYKVNINSINLLNNNFGEINLSNGNKKYLILNNPFMKEILRDNNHYIYRDYDFKDSLNINIKMSNNIESYDCSSAFLLTNQIIDTLSASIDDYKISNDSFLIRFTEPVIVNKNLTPFYLLDEDSTNLSLDYEYINPHLLYINNITNIENININCSAINDFSDNKLCDQELSLSFTKNQNSNLLFGSIDGYITYIGNNGVIVEAINLDTKDVIRKKTDNNYFIFNNLVQGNYEILAYEDINVINDVYFSGTLNPIKKAAKFVVYNKNIYVRPNWTNTISMELK